MSSLAHHLPEPAPILACTIARDVQGFDLLIDDMEAELGESWGDLSMEEALDFLTQPEAAQLVFVVIAVTDRDEDHLDIVVRLTQLAHAAGIRVILTAERAGAAFLHGLLRLGADDFIPYPMPEGALRDAISRLKPATPAPELTPEQTPAQTPAPLLLVGDPLPAEPAAEPAPVAAETPEPMAPPAPTAEPTPPQARAPLPGRGGRDGVILAVQGMAGGTGASTFATNLAWELATPAGRDAPKVCLIDLDFQYGAIATYLDLTRKEAVFELLSDMAHIDDDVVFQAMAQFRDRLSVMTAPSDMLPLDVVGPDDLGRLFDILTNQFDFVVVDMPHTIVAWTETVLHRAHVYFVPLELDLRTAQNVQRLLRALKAEGLPFEKLRYLLNRAPKFTDLNGKARLKRMAESLGIAIEVQLPDGGAQVTQANDHGQPLALIAPKNPLRREIEKLARSLLDLNRVADTGRR